MLVKNLVTSGAEEMAGSLAQRLRNKRAVCFDSAPCTADKPPCLLVCDGSKCVRVFGDLPNARQQECMLFDDLIELNYVEKS